MNGHESFLIKQRVFCEVGSCFRYASRVIKIEGRETVFCHHHPYGDTHSNLARQFGVLRPTIGKIKRGVRWNKINLGGGVENTKSPRGCATVPKLSQAAAPRGSAASQFPSVADQEEYWKTKANYWCCPNCSEIDARQAESMEEN